MSSNIPTRRTTRTTRLPDENAVNGRIPIARGVAKIGTTTITAAGPSKVTTSGSALDANLQNKRKRGALGEVTNNKNKNQPKGVSAKDGKIVKPHVLIPTKPTRTTVKVPIRKTRASAAVDSKEVGIPEADEDAEGENEDAMAVDEPVPIPTRALHRVTRRLSTRTSTVATTTTGTTTTRGLTQGGKAPSVAHSYEEIVDVEKEQGDEADTHRAFKRRKTSSEADVEAVVEAEDHTDALPDNENPVPEVEETNDSPAPDVEEEETGWDDLDKDDFDDPYMVSEYVVDIFKYLSECENQTLPNPNYIQHQGELKWSHRGILMDYLIGLHYTYRFAPETLYLAVNIIDRFLSMRVVSLSKLQLVGLSGFFIACKFEEVLAPSVGNLLTAGAMQDDAKEEDMLKAERYILKTLNWNVSPYSQPMNWLRRISKADDYDPQVRTLAKFFLEIHVVERRLLGVKPSLIAAASIWLGRLVMGKFVWTPNLAHYSGYSEKKIIPVANIMINYCLRPERHENFIRKYASKRYAKTSVYIQDWITSRWAVGDKISLVDELPYLTALVTEGKE